MKNNCFWIKYSRLDVFILDKKNKEKGGSRKCNFLVYLEIIRKKRNKEMENKECNKLCIRVNNVKIFYVFYLSYWF